ncbi:MULTISPECIES: GEVED domain-containing protein [unclassified Aureispira]|uniref:GEVED domain-containing protein n=1 Tax=unclassified Aureispira TaxID=2649989 RepID=UPI0009E06A4C|nr:MULTISPECIES: GEVED domain-containing protein [unclassified Aureispira]WMX15319.1 GEVED domain-containing protein [Aureispira sp. CCB-E]
MYYYHLLLGILISSSCIQAQNYKRMMNDMDVNFYDVCKAADRYFETHSKGKGSGWKGYQRWRAWNESRYYPSGDRKNIDPYFLKHAYEAFLRDNPQPENLYPTGWNDLGPYDANNITTHYSPGIGRVECFYVNPNNTQQMYLGSRSGGFWRTGDGGSTWQNTTDFLLASGVNTMDASPTNSDSVIINIRNASNGASHGIYRSSDAGATWTLTAFNSTNLNWGGVGDNWQIYKIVYHPTIPNLVFVGTNAGLYRSTDNLQTWTNLVPGTRITDIEFHPNSANIIYLYDGNDFGSNLSVILRSTDFGLTFSPSAPIGGNNDAKGILAVTPVCPNCVYFASNNGVWRSDDAGQNFTFLTNPPSDCDGFAVSDVDSLHLCYGDVDTYASSDGGYNFTKVTEWTTGNNPDTTYIHADLRTAECINGVFYVGTDGYFCKSPNNGQSWYRMNDGTGIREFYSVGLSQSNSKVQIAGSQDNGTSILSDSGWIEWYGADGMEAIVQPLNDQWMIGSWQFGGRRRTNDGGASGDNLSAPEAGTGAWEAPLIIDPNSQMKVYHFMDSLYVSDEFGESWRSVGNPSFLGNIQVAAIAENNSDNIVVVQYSEIELSQDGGQTFTNIGAGLPLYFITDVAFDPKNDSTIVVTYNHYQSNNEKIYLSHDMGQTWSDITYNLGNMPLHSVVIDHTNASNIYVGAEIGVYYKPMNSNTWVLYNPSLPNTTIEDLEIQYGTNTIRAATWGRGLWEYSLVGRNSFPAILKTTITDPPTLEAPKMGSLQDVTSVISYNNNLTSVYVKWSANNPTFDSTILMTNIVDSTWKTATPLPIYPTGTKLYFKVYAVGSNGDTTETYKFMYTVRPLEYCAASGSMLYDAAAITFVDFAGISRSSGKTQSYTNYTMTDSATVVLSNTYTLTNHLNTDGDNIFEAKVWIDWNQDFDFEDVGEEYYMGVAVDTFNGPTDVSPLPITVPANAAIGKTRMRVACLDFNPTACMSEEGGEVEDYTIIVKSVGLGVSSTITTPVQIFPNPTKGTFSVDMGAYYESIEIQIMDVAGKLVDTKTFKNKQTMNLNLGEVAGVYVLKIHADEMVGTYKIVKK